MVDIVNTNNDGNPAGEDAAAQAAAKAGDNVSINGNPAATPTGDDDKPTGTPAEKPEWVPEKFWDTEKGEVRVEEMAKSNASLEQKLSGKPADDGKPDGEDGKPNADDDKPNGDDKPAGDDAVKSAQTEWAEKGELSEDTYTALAKAGISKDVVDNYIDGVQARQEAVNQKAFNKAGGSEESYKEMTAWAATNLSESEIAAYDKTLSDPTTMESAVEGLYAKFTAASNSEGKTVHGNPGSSSPGSHYKSSAEMQADMNNPKYKTDAAFRNAVAQKIAASEKANINIFS